MLEQNLLKSAHEREPERRKEEIVQNLPEIFHELYYYLYSNSKIPRAERLGAEMVRIIFSKIYDETYCLGKEQFRAYPGETDRRRGERIRALFEATKKRFPDVFQSEDKLYLDDRSLSYVTTKLEHCSILKTSRDVVGEAFQAFLGPGLRGEKGQFFTPRNVVKLCVAMLNPRPSERIIDPACGSGGFLVECISKVLEREGRKKLEPRMLENIFGIDKEGDLARICKAYLTIIGGSYSNIFCEDSLDVESWLSETRRRIENDSFDLVLTNPPFGARIPITDPGVLSRYELGHKWMCETKGKGKEARWTLQGKKTVKRQDPQILFIERCLKLLKSKGRMAIVLPDGLLGNPSDGYILTFLSERAKILAVVSLDHVAFLPGTHTKTSILFLEKLGDQDVASEDYEIFMAIANRVGHDKNGRQIFKMTREGKYLLDAEESRVVDDELPEISQKYLQFLEDRNSLLGKQDHLGFHVRFSSLRQNGFILIPSYYDPELRNKVTALYKSGDVDAKSIGDLIQEGIISVTRGNEIGSEFYGKGDVPFVRTSDIANWEIRTDPIKCVPESVYESYRRKQDIREDDILLVSDGTFLIGRTAIVTRNDRRIVIQSHVRVIRSLKPEILHPYLLLYLLNQRIVQEQIVSKTFVQATISTVGPRLLEIVLPIPKDQSRISDVTSQISEIMEMKARAREKMDSLFLGVDK